jgi:hypothetical protein
MEVMQPARRRDEMNRRAEPHKGPGDVAAGRHPAPYGARLASWNYFARGFHSRPSSNVRSRDASTAQGVPGY